MSETESQVIDDLSAPAIRRLSRDLRNAAKLMGVREARYFTDVYYQMQDNRIAAGNQQKALHKDQEPSEAITWLNAQMDIMESQVRALLDKWSGAQPMGIWARNVVGIGPVISAGLLANIDITRAPTVGHIWRFAGLDPSTKWGKGQKRPWNASLKRLCWLIGESFVKVSGHKRDIYGKLYLQRKEYESRKNEAGDYAPLARIALERMKTKRVREQEDEDLKEAGGRERLVNILQSGKLPPAALHARSKRWAVKLFLSHWHGQAYRLHYGTEPPKPYPIAQLGHVHEIRASQS